MVYHIRRNFHDDGPGGKPWSTEVNHGKPSKPNQTPESSGLECNNIVKFMSIRFKLWCLFFLRQEQDEDIFFLFPEQDEELLRILHYKYICK